MKGADTNPSPVAEMHTDPYPKGGALNQKQSKALYGNQLQLFTPIRSPNGCIPQAMAYFIQDMVSNGKKCGNRQDDTSLHSMSMITFIKKKGKLRYSQTM